jgi:hypothetical protein
MAPVMENFPALFHEPYYRHYSADNLEQRLKKAGFTDISTQVHFMSKYWIARKPGEGQLEASQSVNQRISIDT